LIEGLLTLARSEQGVMQKEQFDLGELAWRVVDSRADVISRRSLRIATHFQTALVQGDPDLLERLVANVVDNAIGHNVEGGAVIASTAKSRGSVVLRVVNDGPLVGPTEIERLCSHLSTDSDRFTSVAAITGWD
jgi:signal transduction histidine kinase